MNAIYENALGKGIYFPSEAALYARMWPSTMSRWIETVIERQADSGDKIVTFLDFVQSLAVRAIRANHNISLRVIRNALNEAQDKYGEAYPLAKQHKIELWGKRPLIRIGESLIELAGKHKRQHVEPIIVEEHLVDLGFGPDGLANLYTAYRLKNGKPAIVMNPKRRFGTPLMVNSGYTAEALWDALDSAGNPEDAADSCGVSLQEILIAKKYREHLSNKRAA